MPLVPIDYRPWFAVAAFFLVILAIRLSREAWIRFLAWPARRNPIPWRALAQGLLVTTGLAGAAVHTFPAMPPKDAGFPNADTTSLAFLGLIVVAFFLPLLEDIELPGGFKLKLHKELLDSANTANEQFEKTIDDLSDIIQGWPHSLGTLIDHLDRTTAEDVANTLPLRRLRAFLRDRFGEARQVLTAQVNEALRIALWIYDSDTNKIKFYQSNEISDASTMTAEFSRLEGMVGTAFDENRTWNEPNARFLPAFKQINSGSTYQGVLVTPVSLGSSHLGMLTIDRTSATEFTPEMVDLAKGLARLSAIALWSYTALIVGRVDPSAVAKPLLPPNGQGSQEGA